MSSGHQRIKWRRNIAENFNRLSWVHERFRQTTDRQTTDDRRTDDDSEHEHEFTFAKNRLTLQIKSMKTVHVTYLAKTVTHAWCRQYTKLSVYMLK